MDEGREIKEQHTLSRFKLFILNALLSLGAGVFISLFILLVIIERSQWLGNNNGELKKTGQDIINKEQTQQPSVYVEGAAMKS